jgi:hypothetical protein
MSEDYVNQLTLNFLISKTQLDKLNKKRHSDKQQMMKTEKEIFREEIYQLFDDLFDENAPTDLLNDVKDAYEHFIAKSIYYFKVRKSTTNEEDIKEDINYDKECNYNDNEEDIKEESNEEEDSNEEKEEEDSNEEKEEEVEVVEENIKIVHKKHPDKYKLTEGSEDIHKLPLDWFKTTRKNYTMNQILPRKKEIN